MIRGLYSSASGAVSAVQAQQVIVNNLANIATTAFKRDIPLYESFSRILEKKMSQEEQGVRLRESFPDFSQGRFVHTGNTFDLALEGEGFFVISTPQGIAYTRAGNFTLDSEGKLVTPNGFPVMGEDGPIIIPGKKAQDVKFTPEGEVRVNGEIINRIRIDFLPEPSLLYKVGNSLFKPYKGARVAEAKKTYLRQGYLELSNVEPIKEMVELISNFRLYEVNQRVLQLQDDTLDKTCNQVGRIK